MVTHFTCKEKKGNRTALYSTRNHSTARVSDPGIAELFTILYLIQNTPKVGEWLSCRTSSIDLKVRSRLIVYDFGIKIKPNTEEVQLKDENFHHNALLRTNRSQQVLRDQN